MSSELEFSNIQIRTIEEEMRTAYIDYSMSVIVSRALPDVRDGLKPVHRRVLYGMSELGLASDRPYKKSARIVGEVLGKFHPHGDSAIYETMVRMAQPWSLRYPLVDGQGNFGSMDGDSAAALRYTEARLTPIAEEMLADLEKNTVDFQPNFDDSLTEPSVMPAKVPNLLLNGASGIAVGMATNMAPHNLREVVDGIIAYIDNKDITIEELMVYVKAPDFPTGGIIYGTDGIKDAYRTGRGKFMVRAATVVESTSNGRDRIILTQVPYQVNKALLHEKIVALLHDKKIDGISEIRDESDRDGVRLVIELKREAIANVVLNNLFKYTQMQISYSINNICLVKGRPMRLNLKDLIRYYVEHRHDVVVRRTQYELDQALKRAHIIEGLIIALDNLDEVIKLIRASQNPEIAREGLMQNFALSEIQAKAILDMRLQRLTNLERDKIREEYQQLLERINYYRSVLSDETLRMRIIKDELQEMYHKYGDERRTQIVQNQEDIRIEDMIANEEVVITISHAGYIKRTPLSDYRKQGRGGTGSKGAATKEEDFVEYLFVANTHNYLLLFTELGKCYFLKTYEIPEGGRATKGRSINNLLAIPKEDRIVAYINVENLTEKSFLEAHSIIMTTQKGQIKKSSLEAFSRPRSLGLTAINIVEGDKLVSAALCTEESQVVIATNNGYANRFEAKSIREMGRTAAGVRGIRLTDDMVIGMVIINDPKSQLLVLSEKGFGKRSKIEDYPVYNRGGKGVKTINVTAKTGKLIGITQVTPNEDLMIITKDGIALRTGVDTIRETGRAAQGVRLIKIRENDSIASMCKLAERDDDPAVVTDIVEDTIVITPPVVESDSDESQTSLF
jgi:DNA gyrase subunit A